MQRHLLSLAIGLTLTTLAAPGLAQPAQIAVVDLQPNLLIDLGGDRFELDDHEIAAEFYRSFPDEYDYLVIFTDFETRLAGGAAEALYIPVSSELGGLNIGMNGTLPEDFDFTANYGSDGRLKGIILLGNVSDMPDDPYDKSLGRGYSVLSLLGQETLHRFGVFVNYRLPGDTEIRRDLLGRGAAHWSFFFHSAGSDLEGNDWVFDEEEQLFVAQSFGGNLNQLDEYLMGLRLPEQIDEEYFLITNPEPIEPENLTSQTGPTPGAKVRGVAQPITIDMIIDANGPRRPSARDSDKTFRQAFIVVSDPSDLDQRAVATERLERFRRAWVDYFYDRTDFRGRLISRFDGRDDHPQWRFATSAEGWQATGAELEAGIEVGTLRLVPTHAEVHLTQLDLAVSLTEARYIVIGGIMPLLETCTISATLRWSVGTGEDMKLGPKLPLELAADGQYHQWTLPLAGLELPDEIHGLDLAFVLNDETVQAQPTLLIDQIEIVSSATFADDDADGILDDLDNCEGANADQMDRDGNGIGDVCQDVLCAAPPEPTPPGDDCFCQGVAHRPSTSARVLAILTLVLVVLGRARPGRRLLS